MKMYKIHDSMRNRLDDILEGIQTELDMHDEFDTLTYDEACTMSALLDKAENACSIASQKEVDGRTIRFLADFARKYAYLAVTAA